MPDRQIKVPDRQIKFAARESCGFSSVGPLVGLDRGWPVRGSGIDLPAASVVAGAAFDRASLEG
jgi:hypothetical protein